MSKALFFFKGTKNPYLLFAPFLILFIIYVLIVPTNGQVGDESRYLLFAKNLIHGFYSLPPPNIDLTNGPGYPIILMPFIALSLPLICITIMNAIFYYLSIVIIFKTMQQLLSPRITLIFSLFWACYYIAYQGLPLILTETFTYLLISILIFTLMKAFETGGLKQKKKYILLSGFILGYIVLTKVAFAYVLLFMLFGSFVLWLTNRKSLNYRKTLAILLIGFITISPYIIYAYNLTGKIFYLSTASGDTLYWASSPYQDEYGDWKGDLERGEIREGNFNIPGAEDSLKAHHQKDYEEIYKYQGVEQSDAFTRIALNNIKSHPLKYLKNCIYNIGRIIFHYPFSEAVQRPKVLLVFPLNGIVFTLMLFCLIPTIRNWQKIIFPIRLMLIFVLLYLGESSLVSGMVRMFAIIVPVLVFWFAYIFQKSVKINLKFYDNNSKDDKLL